MIAPNYLQAGDRIALVAPAGKIDRAVVDRAVARLQNWGLVVEQAPHLYNNLYHYAASDRERLEDMQDALNDPGLGAILCARGGYGSIRIIDQLNFKKFAEQPKWLVGFSDITLFHAHIQQSLNIETIHGAMAAGLADEDEEVSSRTLYQALFGRKLSYEIPTGPFSRTGSARGQLVGGNLAILTSLLGSKTFPDVKNKILFLEEVGEHLYRIDRMLWSLQRAGHLKGLAGLIVGSTTESPDSDSDFGKSIPEIFWEHIQEYPYPVLMNFPAGHQKDNRALILGREIRLSVGSVASVTFSSLN